MTFRHALLGFSALTLSALSAHAQFELPEGTASYISLPVVEDQD